MSRSVRADFELHTHGPVVGTGAAALGFETGQVVEREPYDVLFGQRRVDLSPLGQRPSGGRAATDLYAQLLAAALLGAVCITAITLIYRPLMLSSIVPEVAEAKRIRSHRIEICFLLIVALATTMTDPSPAPC